jgi:hypothetical protein
VLKAGPAPVGDVAQSSFPGYPARPASGQTLADAVGKRAQMGSSHGPGRHNPGMTASQTPLAVGDHAPLFTLPSSLGRPVALADSLRQGPVVLAWYLFDFGRV